MTTARTVTCPACKGPSVYASTNRHRPFCSERCQQMDLGAWANEDFRLPSATPPDPEGDAVPPMAGNVGTRLS